MWNSLPEWALSFTKIQWLTEKVSPLCRTVSNCRFGLTTFFDSVGLTAFKWLYVLSTKQRHVTFALIRTTKLGYVSLLQLQDTSVRPKRMIAFKTLALSSKRNWVYVSLALHGSFRHCLCWLESGEGAIVSSSCEAIKVLLVVVS